jgi:hypothetical protein
LTVETNQQDDEVLAALDRVAVGLQENARRIETALARIEQVRERRQSGLSYAEIAEEETGPPVVELITSSLLALDQVGHRLRATAAQALRREGVTTARIAQIFGVSRQRISHLLRDATDAPAGADGEKPSPG